MGLVLKEYNRYLKQISKLYNDISAVEDVFEESLKMQKAMANALKKTKIFPGVIEAKIAILKEDLDKINLSLNGSPSRSEVGERNPADLNDYLYNASSGLRNSYGPTPLHAKSLEMAKQLLSELKTEVIKISKTKIPEIQKMLKEADAPYIIGQGIE